MAEPNKTNREEGGQPEGGTTLEDRGRTEVRSERASCEDSSSITWDLTFLLPSSHPGSLGRLGNYEVLGRVGKGGMGLVLKAFDQTLHRTVALKVMHANLAASDENRRRFLREARAAAGINHPNVVTIHFVGEQRGMPYLVMEYVEGITLSERIKRGPPFDEASMVQIGTQIALGLGAAHERGVIHRDIKPSNVMLLNGREPVKITDFGLALTTLDGEPITSGCRVLGTPSYMSPEQVNGREVDPRSDLFSLGCVLYAMAVGRSPFQGTHTIEVAKKIEEQIPPPLHRSVAGISESFSGVVDRLLEKRPDRRFQSAQDLIQALCGQRVAPAVCTPREKPRRLSRRRVRWALIAAACLLAVAGPLLAWALGWRPFASATKVQTLFDDSRDTPVSQASLTVSKTGQADHQTIGEALARAGPGSTIRILDDAVYDEVIRIDDAERLRGLTLEADKHPTLAGRVGKQTVLAVRNTLGLTIRGVQVKPGADQHGIMIMGNVAGLTIDRVTCTHPEESKWANVYICEGAKGSRESPIRLQNCQFEFGEMGVNLDSLRGGAKVCFVQLENNRFLGNGMHIVLNEDVEDVGIRGNIFVGGTGVGMNLNGPSAHLIIGCNTFFHTPGWLRLLGASGSAREVLVYNNLILGAERIDLPGGTVAQLAETWSFKNNWWEPGPQTSLEVAKLVADVKANVALLSRDPEQVNFLRPPPDSPLGSAGAGGDLARHIGALAPLGGAAAGTGPAAR